MVDTMVLLTYLLSHKPGHSSHLQLSARIPARSHYLQNPPVLQWRNIPPETSSIAIIIKEKKTHAFLPFKPHYYWVIYNLPPTMTQIRLNAHNQILAYDQGKNSWGECNYHPPMWGKKNSVVIKVAALNKRLSTEGLTGEQLEKKIRLNTLAAATIIQ